MSRTAALLGFGAALPLALALYGYTVDDALITARMASHLASGVGYRFNPGGPVVDRVAVQRERERKRRPEPEQGRGP